MQFFGVFDVLPDDTKATHRVLDRVTNNREAMVRVFAQEPKRSSDRHLERFPELDRGVQAEIFMIVRQTLQLPVERVLLDLEDVLDEGVDVSAASLEDRLLLDLEIQLNQFPL